MSHNKTENKKKKSIISRIIITVGLIFLLFVTAILIVNYYPADTQSEKIFCAEDAPALNSGQSLKVMSWNVQYMAGKNYVFFYDLPDWEGPDYAPSPEDIAYTLEEVARVIKEENPDIILLQELNEGDVRTGFDDQLSLLLNQLPEEYQCHTSAFYWKSAFAPIPGIMGKVGLKLSIVSKYKFTGAIRYQLPRIDENIIVKQFDFRRCILKVRFPVTDGDDFIVMTTHFDAFAQGSDLMEQQVEKTMSILDNLTAQGTPWIIGGDFNLLSSRQSYNELQESQKYLYNPETEIKPMFENYQCVPSLEEITSSNNDIWFTHYPNDPDAAGPDRTIDYIFAASNVIISEHYVVQSNTLHISDHLPLITSLTLP